MPLALAADFLPSEARFSPGLPTRLPATAAPFLRARRRSGRLFETAMRRIVGILAILCIGLASGLSRPAEARTETAELRFDELYGSVGVLGMEFSAKVRALEGKRVLIRGFMAPPLKADAVFFVLTAAPVSLCPFCNSEADWPADIVVAYLAEGERFVQNNELIEAVGLLEAGSATDPDTGFVSLLRLRDTRVERL